MPAARSTSFEGMVGESAAMRLLRQRIERVAPLDARVLIRGETGTGKELVSRAIWRLSARRDHRFVTVNAGALERELLRSELFGHERGAFTGAIARKLGALVVADGGTVFLDEVGDLPLDAQVTLLRFLESGEVQPVGSTDTKRVDVRVIAATHRDLETMVERGAFREDLYYRLRRLVLHVPPLRDRREDIALLAEHFVADIAERYRVVVRGLTREALHRLVQHPWPGNVRELEAVLEQAVALRTDGWITPENLDLQARRTPARGPEGDNRGGRDAPTFTWVQNEALRIAETRHEVRRRDVMRACGISRRIAHGALLGLSKAGLLERTGQGRGARYVPTVANRGGLSA